MTVPLLVDDHLLLRILLDDEPVELRPAGAPIATTGLWYHRLCRALTDDRVVGSMSRRLGDVGAGVATKVVASVIDLPESIELVSLRALGWPMGERIHEGTRLNLLGLEALAAARHFEAEICVAAEDHSAPLQSAAQDARIPLRLVSG